jgi:hypothetical protein
VCAPAGERVGERRDAQRRGVRRHVPAVREQRHRAEGRARGDLDHHHREGQDDDPAGLAFAGVDLLGSERVRVLPAVDLDLVHACVLQLRVLASARL